MRRKYINLITCYFLLLARNFFNLIFCGFIFPARNLFNLIAHDFSNWFYWFPSLLLLYWFLFLRFTWWSFSLLFSSPLFFSCGSRLTPSMVIFSASSESAALIYDSLKSARRSQMSSKSDLYFETKSYIILMDMSLIESVAVHACLYIEWKKFLPHS